MPVTGVVNTGQQSAVVGALLQSAQTGNANGTSLAVDGYKTIYLWVIENNVGTATLTPQGSFDNVNWFALWAAPTGANGRTFAATLSVTQNSKTYLVLQDGAPFIRAVTSSNSGSVTVGVYATGI
jgi:hypothetical protein